MYLLSVASLRIGLNSTCVPIEVVSLSLYQIKSVPCQASIEVIFPFVGTGRMFVLLHEGEQKLTLDRVQPFVGGTVMPVTPLSPLTYTV